MIDYSDLVRDDHKDLIKNEALFLEIDINDSVSIYTLQADGDGTWPDTVSTYYKLSLRYELACGGDGEVDLDKLRDDLRPGGFLASRIERLIAGRTILPDESKGILNDDALSAHRRLGELAIENRYAAPSDEPFWFMPSDEP